MKTQHTCASVPTELPN